jgi:hypothetical protein
MAEQEDENVKELKQKVSALVTRRFGRDNYTAAFQHYAGRDGLVDADELRRLLDDAGVGNFATKGAWVRGIIKKLDKDLDNKISGPEFESVMRG